MKILKFWFEISKVGSKFWRWEGYIIRKSTWAFRAEIIFLISLKEGLPFPSLSISLKRCINKCLFNVFFWLLNETNSNGPQRGQKTYVYTTNSKLNTFLKWFKNDFKKHKEEYMSKNLSVTQLYNDPLNDQDSQREGGTVSVWPSSNFFSPSQSHLSSFLNFWYPGESMDKTIIERTHSNKNDTQHP